MSIRTPPPYPRPRPVVSVALLANLIGLLLLTAAVVGVGIATYKFDPRLCLLVGSLAVGFIGWRLTLRTDGES